MYRLIIKNFALLAIAVLALTAAPARAADPTEVAKQVIAKALEILKNPAYAGPAHKSQRHRLVKEVVDRHFDYKEMAKRSLGPTWGKLNNTQREEFVRIFAELLEASYADKIDKYVKNVRIDYAGESVDGEYAEVRTIIVRANDRIPISYRLRSESGNWMVYDVNIEGVSLVNNYRTQFSRVISESSYAELVRRLRTKVNEERSGG